MTDRPILFNGAMVRAILDGRKTQTRRVLTLKKGWQFENPCVLGKITSAHPKKGRFGVFIVSKQPSGLQLADLIPCPYGEPGDRLWVRETWGVVTHAWDEYGDVTEWTPDRPATQIREMPFGSGYYSGHVIYAADGAYEWAGDDDGGGEPRSAWHPSILMPRAASRILLEVTNVGLERLHDTSDADALAEGVCSHPDGHGYHVEDGCHYAADPRESFASLWSMVAGEHDWDVNPWVWVAEFKVVSQ